jgi:hypothetical protein
VLDEDRSGATVRAAFRNAERNTAGRSEFVSGRNFHMMLTGVARQCKMPGINGDTCTHTFQRIF